MTFSHRAQRPDARLIFRLRGGRLIAFRYLYRRHYAAAFSYAYCCLGDSAHAAQVTEQAFHSLFCQLTSIPAQTSRHAGCVRLQTLTDVRNMSVQHLTRSEMCMGGAGFKAWVARGAVWPVTDDQRWLTAFRRLSLRQQLVLWHAVVEAEAPSIVAAIAGLALHHVPQARADVLDSLLYHFQPAGDGVPVGRLDGLHGPHYWEKRFTMEGYVRWHLPRILLGWWPGVPYHDVKHHVPACDADPWFLRDALRSQR
ncbi:hypothetical protein AV521_36825 [Streptomyces sp. IMTB 2501]|uniref:hypothetical protein n=1 Tax=Streptomyces sp. IMTB 2501 TaxID=1776340 RepID=UPI00096D29CF|nr:hypothetical protein [Streptomyces sp. IMTB 2501]OLZ64094.1 hypothetical protein AV521_36825 [Streptomyces sp. IMTB 2501]